MRTSQSTSMDSSGHSSRWFVAVLAMVTLVACVDSSVPVSAPAPADDIPTNIVVTPDAIVMAVGDTFKVSVVARNTFGDTMDMAGIPVKWTSSDQRIATVTSDGAVIAHTPTTAYEFVQLTASWTKNAVTHVAGSVVNVTPTREPIAGLKILVDSNRTSTSVQLLGGPATWGNVIAVDANGDSIAAPYVLLVRNPRNSVREVSAAWFGEFGVLLGGDRYIFGSTIIGDYWLHARSTIYGVPMRSDSLKFVGLYPVDAVITIAQDSVSGSPISLQRGHTVTVQPCAHITFTNDSRAPIDIVFDDSTKTGRCVPSDQVGNIRRIRARGSGVRKFPATGTIKWTVHNPQTGAAYPGMSGYVQMRTP